MAQIVFKVSSFRINTRTKTHAPLFDCRINNGLILQFVPSCQDTRTQFVDVLDPPFGNSIISCLVVGIFMLKNSIVTKFCHSALGGPVIMPHRAYTSSIRRTSRMRTSSTFDVILQTNAWRLRILFKSGTTFNSLPEHKIDKTDVMRYLRN